ncbi:MAG TPA: DUF4266 domain-containing protein [Polyangiaceae bacterium]|jgi:hypothetical protein|nr:DUF4266 domain-containing protein [Polyangiaceae bacterium]
MERRRTGRETTREPGQKRARRLLGFAVIPLLALSSIGCVTVRPEQRAILSDPKMRFQGDPRTAAEMDHVLENREGSFGGGSVEGGGCGCN